MATRPNLNQIAEGTPSEGDVIKNVSGVMTWGAGGGAEVVISPAPGTTENNYTPTGWSGATIVRLNPSGASSITGFSATATAVRKTLVNISAFNVTLQHQNTGSDAANRIIALTGGLVLEPDDVADLWYDSTTARWRIV
jgi:hypothetical protein